MIREIRHFFTVPGLLDPMYAFYLVSLALTIFLAIMFGEWWHKIARGKKEAPTMFKWMTWFWIVLAIHIFGEMLARHFLYGHHQYFDPYLEGCWWWIVRLVPFTIVLGGFSWNMGHRRFIKRRRILKGKLQLPYGRRVDDY